MKADPQAEARARIPARSAPTHGQIAREAEALWRQRGCPVGVDTQTWLDAEKRLHRAQRSRKAPFKSDAVMGELENLFPSNGGRETTSI